MYSNWSQFHDEIAGRKKGTISFRCIEFVGDRNWRSWRANFTAGHTISIPITRAVYVIYSREATAETLLYRDGNCRSDRWDVATYPSEYRDIALLVDPGPVYALALMVFRVRCFIDRDKRTCHRKFLVTPTMCAAVN